MLALGRCCGGGSSGVKFDGLTLVASDDWNASVAEAGVATAVALVNLVVGSEEKGEEALFLAELNDVTSRMDDEESVLVACRCCCCGMPAVTQS